MQREGGRRGPRPIDIDVFKAAVLPGERIAPSDLWHRMKAIKPGLGRGTFLRLKARMVSDGMLVVEDGFLVRVSTPAEESD